MSGGRNEKLRLASEMSGVEGKYAISEWVSAFTQAIHAIHATLPTPSSSPSSSPSHTLNGHDIRRIETLYTAAATTTTTSSSIQSNYRTSNSNSNTDTDTGEDGRTQSPPAYPPPNPTSPPPSPTHPVSASSSPTVTPPKPTNRRRYSDPPAMHTTTNTAQQFKSTENVLLSLCLNHDTQHLSSRKECVVLIDIVDIGCWFVKFRHHGIIVNNRDLVHADCVDVDGSLCFPSSGLFWTIMNGGVCFEDALNGGSVKCSGASDACQLLWNSLIAMIPNFGISGGSNSSNMWSTAPSGSSGSSGGGSSGGLSVSSIASSIVSHLPGKGSNNSGIYTHLAITVNDKPIKSGWLLKKRDTWNAWRCRYFVLYTGKLAYYTDQHDTTPKAIIPLVGQTPGQTQRAAIYAEKQCTINGNPDHWYLM